MSLEASLGYLGSRSPRMKTGAKTDALFGVLTKGMRSPIISHLVDSLHLQLLPPKYLGKSSEEALPQNGVGDAPGDTAQESAEKDNLESQTALESEKGPCSHHIIQFI